VSAPALQLDGFLLEMVWRKARFQPRSEAAAGGTFRWGNGHRGHALAHSVELASGRIMMEL
jgi:hypothetical protein